MIILSPRIRVSRCFVVPFFVAFVGFIGTHAQSTIQVTVPSNPLWTNTGVTLRSGQTISISASGSWNWGQAVANFGPDGDPNTPFPDYGDEFDSFDIEDHGRLIAFVGTDPLQGEWRNSLFFPQVSGYISIGSGKTFFSPYGGTLWLGFNDDAVVGSVDDNTGQVIADITIGNKDVTGPNISITVPSTTYLLNQKVAANYSCTDPDDPVASCAGPVANGSDVDTTVGGIRAFTVTATDSHGNTSAKTQVYLVGNVGPTPGLLDFQPQAIGRNSPVEKITLHNAQSVPQDITSVGVSGNFTESTTCTAVLAAHQNCSVSVRSTGATQGVNGGFVIFTFPTGTELAGLVAFATPVTLVPSSVSYGNQKVGTTSPAKKVRLTNGLTTGLTISSINVSGDFALASLGTCPKNGTVAAGASCIVAVTFKPKLAGLRSGNLVLQTSYPTAPVSVSMSGTGTN
jgi:uncharacterized membrane protein